MRKPQKGQMALIMILLIGLAFIFFAIAVNWSRVAGNKARVTVAANSGTSVLVSGLSSYAEYFIQVSLGGQLKKCSGTSLLVAIIVLIIIIIIVIISCYGGCYGAALFTVFGVTVGATTLVVISIVLMVISIFLNALVLQPGLTKQWNKWQSELSDVSDEYLEHGIMAIMPQVVSDDVEVQDVWDLDMDGNFSDKVSRYAYYYTDRMKSAVSQEDSEEIKAIQAAFQTISDTIGLGSTSTTLSNSEMPEACYDDGNLKPECNQCCQDRTMRPPSCYGGDDRTQAEKDAGVPIWHNAPPIDYASGCTAANQYNPLYSVYNTSDADGKLVKVIGLDDSNPNNDSGSIYFKGEDSSEGSVFRSLWTIADSQPKIEEVDATTLPTDPGCHWCDSKAVGACTPEAVPLYRPLSITDQLAVDDCSGKNCCTNFFWSDVDDATAVSSIEMDLVGNVSTFEAVGTNGYNPDDAVCAGDTAELLNWKRGGDYDTRTFSDNTTKASYDIKVATDPPGAAASGEGNLVDPCKGSEGSSVYSCICSDPSMPSINKIYWRDDAFDEMVEDFKILKRDIDALLSADTPKKRKALANNATAIQESLLADADMVDTWTTALTTWSASITEWLAPGGETYADPTKWCVPADGTGMSDGEYTAISGAGAWGSLDSVLACLLWNSDNPAHFDECSGSYTSSEASGRYKCEPPSCTNMPRLLSTFDGEQCENVEYQSSYSCKEPCDTDGDGVNDSQCDSTCYETKTDYVYTQEYMDSMTNARELSVPQATKMAKRYAYLAALKEFIVPLQAVFDSAAASITGLGDTIRTNANLLADIDTDDTGEDLPLGNKVIYGWASEKPKQWTSGNRSYGYLHLVKVEAAIPKRSTGVYGVSGIDTCASLNSDGFPWVKTYTKNWGTKRCYELKDHDGCVGVRVIRYDEDHDAGQGGIMKFLSGLKLWRIMYHNPWQPEGDARSVAGACFGTHWSRRGENNYVVLENEKGFTGGVLKQAFMLNLPFQGTPPAGLLNCYNKAEALLERGIVSQTCAKYFASGTKMDMKFMPCSTCCGGTSVATTATNNTVINTTNTTTTTSTNDGPNGIE